MIEAIGSIRIADGTGCRIIRGAGLRSTMGAGFAITVLAGAGLQIMFGVLLGFPGDIRVIIVAGRLCRQPPASGPASDLVIWAAPSDSISISVSPPVATASFPLGTSAITGYPVTS